MKGFPLEANYAEFDKYGYLSSSSDSSDESADPLELEELGSNYKEMLACDDSTFDECIIIVEKFVVHAFNYHENYVY